MSTISIPLSDEDLDFLRSFAREQGTTAEQFLAGHARTLRLNLQLPLHPDVAAATGAFKMSADPQSDYLEYLGRKHR